MKVMAITGVPGTGKTTISKELLNSLKNCLYVDLTKLIKENNLSTHYDELDKTYEVDIKKLITFLENFIMEKQNENQSLNTYEYMILDGHLSHFIPSNYIDLVIYLKSEIEDITKRLSLRTYSLSKIKDNTESQILNIIEDEIKTRGHKYCIINTSTSGIDSSIKQILTLMNY